MKRLPTAWLVLGFVLLLLGDHAPLLKAGRAAPLSPMAATAALSFYGLCNASAGIDLGSGLFVVADDEGEISGRHPLPLRIYDRHQPGKEVFEAILTARDLATDSTSEGELDLEAAARIGDRIYWIGSHSASRKGRERPSTQLFFATRLKDHRRRPAFHAVGRPYRRLLRDLDADPRYRGLDLIGASRLRSKAEGGLSIEGLAATPSGGVLIGFRNPLVDRNQALVVPLLNPAEVLEGGAARFGNPVHLDLNGAGVRSIEWVKGAYWIIAGPWGEQGADVSGSPFALYRWSGNPSEAPEVVPGQPFRGEPPLQPEGLFQMDGRLRVISDDGKIMINGTACQDIKKRKQQRFRSVEITPFRD